MDSTRFPGKPLVDLQGKPMVQWVWEAAMSSGVAERVVVATPDDAILKACANFGAEAIRTRADHPSGTDRLAEVSHAVHAEVYVNVQGDEPLISPETIKTCAQPLLRDATIAMGSIYTRCAHQDVDNPAVVKVVTDQNGFALYFSRHAIPFARNPRPLEVKKHVGIYAYRKLALQSFAAWPVSPLEFAEGLEQLRFLENGVRIMMSEGAASELAIDTPEQAAEVRKILAGRRRRSG